MTREKILLQGLVLLTLICVADGFLMRDFMSLIVALGLMFLAELAWAGSKPGAPHAETNGIGSVYHQSVYIRALNRTLDNIAATREMWKVDPDGNGGAWHRKYERAKWTYALIYNRYEQAKKVYGWKY